MSDVLISVVVPVWNAGRYLGEALESLRAQTHARFEAILVNDGSTDDSPDICRRFCRLDSRFVMVDRANGGVSAARNAGIEMAKGEWIAFMDADDIMLPRCLQTLLEAAQASGAGIAVGGYSRSLPGSLPDRSARWEAVDSRDAILIGLYQEKILNNPWGVLFSRRVFEGEGAVRFRSGRYEDLDLFYRAFMRVDTVCLVSDMVYYYRDAPGSFINTWSASRLDVLDVTDRMVEAFAGGDPALLRAAHDRRFSAHFNMLVEMWRHRVDNPAQRRRCIDVIKRSRRAELADPRVRLKNKAGALLSYIMLGL